MTLQGLRRGDSGGRVWLAPTRLRKGYGGQCRERGGSAECGMNGETAQKFTAEDAENAKGGLGNGLPEGPRGRERLRPSATDVGAWTLTGRRRPPWHGYGSRSSHGRLALPGCLGRRHGSWPCQGGNRCGQVRIDKEYV